MKNIYGYKFDKILYGFVDEKCPRNIFFMFSKFGTYNGWKKVNIMR